MFVHKAVVDWKEITVHIYKLYDSFLGVCATHNQHDKKNTNYIAESGLSAQ